MGITETMATITELAKKGLTVELREKIMDLREDVIALKEENQELRSDNLKLKQQIKKFSKGEQCPKCRKATWELIASKPHPILKDLGMLERTYECSECGFSEKRRAKGVEEK